VAIAVTLSCVPISDIFGAAVNEEPSDKRAEKLHWLGQCLPNDWQRLMDRPPLENYMDPELCGKWIVRHVLLHSYDLYLLVSF